MAAAVTKEKTTLLSTLRDVTFFVAIYLYFTGFVYSYYFYDHFGIPLRQVETPVYYFFVYSYSVMSGIHDITWVAFLKQKPIWTFVLVISVFAVVLILTRRSKRKRILLFSFLIFLFPILFYLARETSKSDALKIRTGETAKEITFVFKQGTSATRAVRILKSLSAEDVNDKTARQKQNATNDPSNASQETATSSSKKSSDTEVADSPEKAELNALERFLEANNRTVLEVKTDQEANVESNWPKLYLLTETANSFYVILQPSIDHSSLPFGYVYEIAKADVLLSEIHIPQQE